MRRHVVEIVDLANLDRLWGAKFSHDARSFSPHLHTAMPFNNWWVCFTARQDSCSEVR